jgi:ArsR family transcriptional regulator, arsenate/arsenite/antimonite-responsive transcriptional repressor
MINDDKALTVLAALAQETRLRIMRALLRSHPDGLAAGRLATAVDCSRSTMSFHLAQLEQAGLAQSRRQATSVIYTAVPGALGGLVAYLLDDCCGGRPDLCADLGVTLTRGEQVAAAAPCGGSDRPEAADRDPSTISPPSRRKR